MNLFFNRLLVYWVLGLPLALPANAQSARGTISGHIRSENGEPLPGINVGIDGTAYGASTNEQGRFKINRIPAGNYTLSVSGVGYQTQQQSVVVRANQTTVLNYQLNSQTSELSEVTVTAGREGAYGSVNKLDVPARDLPLTTSAVSLQLIEQRGIDDLGAAMKNVSGVRANNTYGGFQHFTIRGFQNFVLLVDGVRDERHNISTSAPTTNLANVERIEVLKGPASVLFGHSALGGIINIVRKQPSTDFRANASAAYGSFNTRRMRVGAGGPITDKLRYRVDFGMSNTDGYRDFGTTNNNAYLALEYTPSDKDNLYLTIGANKDVYDTDTGIPMLAGSRVTPGMDVDTRYNDPADFLRHTRYDFQLRYTRQLTSRLRLFNQLSYYDDNIDYFSTEELTFNATRDSLTRSFPFYFNHLTKPLQNQLELTYAFNTGSISHKLLTGYSLSALDRRTYRGDIFGPGKLAQISVQNPILDQGYINYADTRDQATLETVHGLYVQDWLRFSDQLKALIGVRYDVFQGRYFTNQVDPTRRVTEEGPETKINVQALTYRAGIVYQPVQPLSVYGSYSTYFKPSRRMAADGQTFDPETGYQAEIGSRLEFTTKLTASVAAYYMRKDNQVESLSGGLLRPIGSAESKGVEVDLQGSPVSGLNVNVGYTFTDARYLAFDSEDVNPVAGNRAIFAPPHLLNVWINYEWPQTALKGLSIGAGVNYSGETLVNSANTHALPAYTVVDATMGYQVNRIGVRFNLNNVLNTRYFNNAIFDNQFYPAPTRNYLLSVSYKL